MMRLPDKGVRAGITYASVAIFTRNYYWKKRPSIFGNRLYGTSLAFKNQKTQTISLEFNISKIYRLYNGPFEIKYIKAGTFILMTGSDGATILAQVIQVRRKGLVRVPVTWRSACAGRHGGAAHRNGDVKVENGCLPRRCWLELITLVSANWY